MPSIDGLISGLDTTSIIQSLLEFGRKPIEQLETRIENREEQKNAINDLSTKLLGLKLTSFNLTKGSTYRATDVSSSNDNIISATGTSSENTGSFDFRVARLARSSQVVSDGMPDSDTSTVGAGTFTVEMGEGFVDFETHLSTINGGDGFDRGSVRITDGSGTSQVVDLSLAVTVQDVVDTLNETTSIQITAAVSGDALTVSDASGGGSLTIAEISDGTTAESLGLLKNDVAGVINGNDINYIKASTRVDLLNNGQGIRFVAGDDFRIRTEETGIYTSFDIDDPETVQDILDAINNDTDNNGKILAEIDSAGKSIKLTDTTAAGPFNFQVQSLAGPFGISNAMVDLGLNNADILPESITDGDQDPTNGRVIFGERLLAPLNSVLTRSLQGGYDNADGVAGQFNGGITITDRKGNTDTIDLSRRIKTNTTVAPTIGATSVTVASASGFAVGNTFRIFDGTNVEYRTATSIAGNVVSFGEGLSYNYAAASYVYAEHSSIKDITNSISGNTTINVTAKYNKELNGLRIVDDNSGTATSDLKIVESGGTVAADLGLKTGVTGAHTVSVGGSTTQLTSATLAALNLQDDELNGLELEFTAGPNNTLKRTILDFNATTGVVTFDTAFPNSISAAETFTIDGIDADEFNGFDVNKQYISENTKLDNMKNGKGVFLGTFQVTDRNNKIFQVDMSTDETIDDTILTFNAAALAAGSDARLTVNTTGNGLLITSPTGTGQITVQDLNGGTTAQDLRLSGSSTTSTLNGSYEYSVTLDGTETLSDLRDTLNALDLDMSVTIIDDGSLISPKRLNIVSNISGRPGRLLFDDFDNSFDFNTTTQAEDASVIFGGSGGGSSPVLVTSHDNTVADLIPGLTLNLKKASSEIVTISIARNTSAIIDSVDEFVNSFNEIMEEMKELTQYDSETEERGLLQGNSALRSIEADLFRTLTATLPNVASPFNRASSIGISIKADGVGLEFDDAELRSKLDTDFDLVARLLDQGATIAQDTELSDLRGGRGVRKVSGANDFEVVQSDGNRFSVNLDSADTIAEAIVLINFNASNPGTVVASMRSDGEGIEIIDSSGGTGNFVISAMNNSSAALDLGIQQQGVTSGSNLKIKGFSLRDQGLFGNLNGRLSFIVDSGGTLDSQTNSFDKMIEDLQDQADRIEERLLSQQERLFREFTELESTLGELQNQSSFVASMLAGL